MIFVVQLVSHGVISLNNVSNFPGLTAIEAWMLACILFVFGALVEYAAILFRKQTGGGEDYYNSSSAQTLEVRERSSEEKITRNSEKRHSDHNSDEMKTMERERGSLLASLTLSLEKALLKFISR